MLTHSPTKMYCTAVWGRHAQTIVAQIPIYVSSMPQYFIPVRFLRIDRDLAELYFYKAPHRPLYKYHISLLAHTNNTCFGLRDVTCRFPGVERLTFSSAVNCWRPVLQSVDVKPEVVASIAGARLISVSSMVMLHPRRRKFHRPVTVSVPLSRLPAVYSSNVASDLRLFYSLSGDSVVHAILLYNFTVV